MFLQRKCISLLARNADLVPVIRNTIARSRSSCKHHKLSRDYAKIRETTETRSVDIIVTVSVTVSDKRCLSGSKFSLLTSSPLCPTPNQMTVTAMHDTFLRKLCVRSFSTESETSKKLVCQLNCTSIATLTCCQIHAMLLN
jgi:hypothetical protein